MVVEYTYDTANRLTDTRYPTQYGTAAGNKLVHYDYDGASRPTAVKVNNAVYGSQLTYNASGQLLSMLVGASGANQLQETYLYDDKTGLISNQKVMRGTTALLDLTHFMYNSYARAGRTGQLSKLINNLNAEKTRIFTYDALGRLSKVTNNSTWSQNYTYDRYGNRRTVTSSNSIANLSPAPPQPQEFHLASHEPPRDASPARLRGETSHYVSNVSQASTLSHHPANTLTRMHDDDLRLESSERGAALNAPTQMPTPSPQPPARNTQTQQTDTTTAAPDALLSLSVLRETPAASRICRRPPPPAAPTMGCRDRPSSSTAVTLTTTMGSLRPMHGTSGTVRPVRASVQLRLTRQPELTTSLAREGQRRSLQFFQLDDGHCEQPHLQRRDLCFTNCANGDECRA